LRNHRQRAAGIRAPSADHVNLYWWNSSPMQSDIPHATERLCRESAAQRLELRLEILTARHFEGIQAGSPGAHPPVRVDTKAAPNGLWDAPSHREKSIEVMVELFLPRVVQNHSRGDDRGQL